ncbi:MAG: glycosyltransferase family 2 protein [Thomasclavelia sp.]|nr:glycosyltransferase family 2 protein [Thomasclavelia sp.]
MELSQIKLTPNNVYKINHINVKGCRQMSISVIVTDLLVPESFFAFSDNKQIDFTFKLLAKNKLEIEIPVPNKSKKITLAYLNEGKYYKLYQKKINWLLKFYQFLHSIISKVGRLCLLFSRGIRFLWREHHFLIPLSLWKDYLKRFTGRVNSKGEVLLNPYIQSDYLKWIEVFETKDTIEKQQYEPLLSIIIPVYNVDGSLLSECLDSVLNQSYQNFEVCIVDDCSSKEETLETLKKYEMIDSRIKIKHRTSNGHISKASNDAIAMAQGEFICLLDNDDTLAIDALYENVLALNHNNKLDLIYSDEDKLDLKGNRCDPHFKPNFSPDTLLGLNYITHFTVIRKTLVEKVGAFEVGLEGVQDHDLFLKITESTNNIYHIPKILYHWRMIEGSTSLNIDSKGYAIEKGIKAVNNALARRNATARVDSANKSTVYKVEYTYSKEPSVSIIIPVKDNADVTRKCLESIYDKTDYSNYEIIIVDNRSCDEDTFTLLKQYENKGNFRVIKADFEFNYSAINNLAVKESNSDVILLLNNDTKIISSNWLSVMVGYAMQPHIGAVGPKLLYPDNTIQHGGIILGLFDSIAYHAFLTKPREDVGIVGRLLIPYDFAAVTGACLAVERKKYEKVQGLDESLAVAYNDVDFCCKLLDAGYYNVLVPQIELYHYESKSRGLDTKGEKYKKFITANNYMHKKWDKYILNDPYYNPNFSKNGAFMLERERSV